ncbi:Peptidylprolyl isomerase domain and WD repeat-containing protein 1 [Blattella germanica]|nr:Peptidylprolyl isomerase domain and WD repeat-containing protein 1 [Blattella germanica]
MSESTKRRHEEDSEDDSSSDGWVGPLPSEAAKPKKVKVLKHEQLYLGNLPSAESYERSYMHRDVITHIVVTKSDADTNKVYIYDGQGTNTPLHVFDKLHTKAVVIIKYNPVYEVALSVDRAGILEYWTGPKKEYKFPKCVKFESKLDTDLFEFAKSKTFPSGLSFSPDGTKFATLSGDRKILDALIMAAERDLEKSEAINLGNIIFDESGYFVLYATMLGVKVVNLFTNRCVKIIGKPENLRPLKLALFQGRARKSKAAVTVEMEASENPTLDSVRSDPTLFCTAFKKNRFYMFTRREPEDTKSQDADRDIFNEKPSKEDIIAATEASGVQRLYETAIIHTALGDIHLKMFAKECPRAVENF